MKSDRTHYPLPFQVINFTVSRTTAMPTWTSWLDDWKHSAGAEVTVFEQQQKYDSKSDPGDEIPAESTPDMPIKKFG